MEALKNNFQYNNRYSKRGPEQPVGDIFEIRFSEHNVYPWRKNKWGVLRRFKMEL